MTEYTTILSNEILVWAYRITVMSFFAILYTIFRRVNNEILRQIINVNQNFIDSQNKFISFIENDHKENTRTISDIICVFKDHIKNIDNTIEQMQKQYQELLEILDKKEKIDKNENGM